MPRGCGAALSRRARRRGDGLVLDFCFSFLATPRRRSLRRRWEEGDRFAGVVAVGSLRPAVGRWMPWPVLDLWSDGGGSGYIPRRRRPEWLDPVEEGELGAVPQPARHSERWALWCFFWWFTKPLMAMELLPFWDCWSTLRLFSVVDAGGERRVRVAVAELSKDLVEILLFFEGFSAIYMGLWAFLDLSCCVRVLYSVRF